MPQPVTYGSLDSAGAAHVWVSDTAVYQPPVYRLAGACPAEKSLYPATRLTVSLHKESFLLHYLLCVLFMQ